MRMDELYGPADPGRHDRRSWQAGDVSYQSEVQPILTRRCVVCHACYDAPCQLKLTAWEGVARGASKDPVYATRLVEAPPTRLFEDARQASEWRQLGFHPVLNEHTAGPDNNLAASLIHRLLDQKARHPLPPGAVLPADSFEFDLNRELSCPNLGEAEGFAARHPQWGMPYALPAISPEERAVITRWLAQGAPAEPPAPLPAGVARQVAAWEDFLNGPSLKEQLMGRYIYEHLFLGHLYFGDDPAHRYFHLARSATPPGEPLERIATRRPYDDPGVPRVWYRLVPDPEVTVAKTHMPYRLDAARMARWRQLFLAPEITVTALPSYDPRVATNPFEVFAALPAASRYRFMLDEAQFTVMGFIKGPVCRGQVALSVINDHFWVFFAQPAVDARDAAEAFLRQQAPRLALPAGWSNARPLLLNWLHYSRQEADYLEAKSRFLDQTFDGRLKITTALVWDGDGANPNAALTIFRHLDSASVVQGLAGGVPKTAWILNYPLLERIHYLLVAGFDVYGDVDHQLESRLYMDFLRMEGEFNFLALLPKASRPRVRDAWYRDASEEEKSFVYGEHARLEADSDIPYRTQDPQAELFGMLEARLAPALGHRNRLDSVADPALRRDLRALAGLRGAALSWLPENLVLRVDHPAAGPLYLSLMRNTGHRNVSQIFDQSRLLEPADNSLSIVPGIVGAYPNALYRLPAAELPALAAAIAGLASEGDYRRLADRYGVRRTSPEFWAASDALHAAYARLAPLEAGVLDYGRLENR
jgi:hypothetical protein